MNIISYETCGILKNAFQNLGACSPFSAKYIPHTYKILLTLSGFF